jgi:hypothetical protein
MVSIHACTIIELLVETKEEITEPKNQAKMKRKHADKK